MPARSLLGASRDKALPYGTCIDALEFTQAAVTSREAGNSASKLGGRRVGSHRPRRRLFLASIASNVTLPSGDSAGLTI